MYSAAFEYHPVQSVNDAVALLERYPDEAKLLAGGHSLIPLMKLRFAQPKHLIDLRRVPGLSGVREEDGQLVIGAMTTYRQLETSDLVRSWMPMLAEAASRVGDLQVRNMGTIGGSLAHADPAADLPAVVLALGGMLQMTSRAGVRSVPAEDFFLALMTTALAPAEVLTEIRIPMLPPRTGSAYEKDPHPASGYALCGTAAVLTLDAQGKVARARVTLTGVTSRPTRSLGVERELVGRAATDALLRQAAEHAVEGLQLRPDSSTAEGYQQQLARSCTRRALHRALQRARIVA